VDVEVVGEKKSSILVNADERKEQRKIETTGVI
jgi:hypothetical protein